MMAIACALLGACRGQSRAAAPPRDRPRARPASAARPRVRAAVAGPPRPRSLWARPGCTGCRGSSTTARCATSWATRRGPASRSCPADVQRSVRQRLHDAARLGRAHRGVETLARRTLRLALLADPARRDALSGCTPTGPRTRPAWTSFVQALRAARVPPPAHERRGRRLGLAVFAVEAGDFLRRRRSRRARVLQDPSFLYRVEVGDARRRAAPASSSSTTTRSARGSPTSCGARRPATPCSTWRRRARSARPRAGAPRPRSCSPTGAAPTACARSTRSGSATTSCPSTPTLGDAAARRDRRARDARRAREEGRLPGALPLARDVPHRRAGHALRAARARLDDGRLGALPGERARRAAAASSRTAPCWRRARSSTTPAPRCAACSCATACCARTCRRRPPNVMVDQPPARTPSRCKFDRYARAPHGRLRRLPQPDRLRSASGWRTTTARASTARPTRTRPSAPSGDGQIGQHAGPGDGKFNGPGGAGALLVASGGLESCVVTQLFRMAYGRRETPDDAPVLVGADRRVQAATGARSTQLHGRRGGRPRLRPPARGAIGGMALRITRRAVLRGLGGVAIALPALEVMFDRHGEAYAQGAGHPQALPRLLRRAVAGRRRRSAAQRLRAQHRRPRTTTSSRRSRRSRP